MRVVVVALAVVGAWFARADRLMPILDASLDASRPARGLQLSFVRSYVTSTNSYSAKGVLGCGWSDNLTASVRRDAPDVLAFPDGPGKERLFVEVKCKWRPVDLRDATELTETTAAYVLKYENGVTRSFSKENMRTSFIQDNQGNSLAFTWRGNELLRVAHTDGQSLSFSYDNGLMTSVTDDCGRKTEFRYENGLLTEVESFDGRIVRYGYRAKDKTPASCALVQITRPDGTVRSFEYDMQGRVTSVSDGTVENPAIRKTTTTWSDGDVAVIVAPDGGRSVLKFGVNDEILQMTDALGNTRRYSYATNGILESITAPSGNKVSVEHDKRGRIVALVAASGAKTKFAYAESFGNLACVTDANGQALSYGYDPHGRATSVTFPDGSLSRLSYNARGDMTESRNRRAQAITRVYDAQGRVVRMTWPCGRMFQYVYDARGNLLMAQDSETGAIMISYDKNDRMTRIVYPGNRGLEFAYDSLGRLDSRKLFGVGSESAAVVERFAYNAEGRLASLSDGDGKLYLANEYDAKTGRLAKQTYGNGMAVSNAYDHLGRITGIYHGRPVSMKPTHLAFFEYTYDADGRCIASRTQDGWETYAYDADGQLTTAFYPNGTKDMFSYDAVGNRKTSGEATYAVNSLNQYTTISTPRTSASRREECLAYDLDGNMVSQKDEKDEARYFYDALNRLVAVTNETAGVHWSCKYDALGNRVSVTDNGVTTERIFIPGFLSSVAAEFADGKLTKRHIVAGAVHIATRTTNPSPLTTEYYHGDIIGSVRLITDESGREISRSSYTVFGSSREGRAPARPYSVGYVGMFGVETDPTGLLFMRNRYYSSSLGRFITPDPIGIAGGDVNWYRYCGNAPIICTDILGLVSIAEMWNHFSQLSFSEKVGYTGIAATGILGGGLSALSIPFTGGVGVLGAGAGALAVDIAAEGLLGVSVTDAIAEGLSSKLSPKDDIKMPTAEEWEAFDESVKQKYGLDSTNKVKKEKRAKGRRNVSSRERSMRQPKRDRADKDDDELSPDKIPDPDNDNYVWCECSEEGMRPLCPADTTTCIYWECSRCGHVIRKKAQKAKDRERKWKSQGIESVWRGTQFEIRQAKSVE